MRQKHSTRMLAVTLICSLLSGCSSLVESIQGLQHTDEGYRTSYSVDGMKLNGTTVDLSHVVAVVPLYELADSTSYPKDRSQLAFIFDDGSYKIQDNHYMFGKRVAWTKKGLFYSDRRYDYFISASTHTIKSTPHKKTEFEYTTYELDENHALTVYNKGIYIENNGVLSVAAADGKYSEKTYTMRDENIFADSLVLCQNGNVYDAGWDGKDPELPQNVLYQLSEGNNPVYKHVHTISSIKAEDLSDAPEILEYTWNNPKMMITSLARPGSICLENWLYTTVDIGRSGSGMSENPRGYAHALLKWNVETGEYKLLPLRDENGSIYFTTPNDEWNTTNYTTGSLQGNTFTIMSTDTGSIAEIDLNTGRLHRITDPIVPREKWPGGKAQLYCTDDYIYQIWIPVNDTLGKHSYINLYSRKTHELVKRFTIDDKFTEYEQNDTAQPGYIAFNPDLLLEKISG